MKWLKTKKHIDMSLSLVGDLLRRSCWSFERLIWLSGGRLQWGQEIQHLGMKVSQVQEKQAKLRAQRLKWNICLDIFVVVYA